MELQALTEIKNNQIKPETRDLMKNHQIDVNCLDEANKTALYIAVERGYEGIAKWLIEQGASVKENGIYIKPWQIMMKTWWHYCYQSMTENIFPTIWCT